MSKLIQKAGFMNPKRAGRYMNYIATCDGVELVDENADSIYMRGLATTTPQVGGRCCVPNRRILRKPCRFRRRSFAGMQHFTMRVSIRTFT